MIYIVAPTWMEHIDECRAFTSYSAMETYVLTYSAQRKTWGADPEWCNVFAFGADIDMYHPVFRYYIRDGHLMRVPVTRSP